MPLTNYQNEVVLRDLFGATAYSVPANHFIALSTTPPSQVQGSVPYWNFTEPSGNNYARVEVANNTTTWTETAMPPTLGWAQANAIAITFPTASGAWGSLDYFGIWDSLAGGNLLGYGELSAAQTTSNGTVLSFSVQALVIQNS